MQLKLTEKEVCPRCGKRFDCSKSGKCWCFELDIPGSVLETINNQFDSCLCPGCLKELTKKLT